MEGPAAGSSLAGQLPKLALLLLLPRAPQLQRPSDGALAGLVPVLEHSVWSFFLLKKIGKFKFLSSVTLNIFYLSDGKSGMSQVLNKYLLLQVKTLVFNHEINWFSPVHYTS